MKRVYLKEIDSTQLYLIEALKTTTLKAPICVWSDYQTNGIGSRGNRWIGKRGNLFFSFAIDKDLIDAPIQSLSIYFGFLVKKALNNLGSEVVLKWPNDLYLKKKVGGVITQVVGNLVVCGIGINTKFAPDGFDSLDIDVKNDTILDGFFDLLDKRVSWREVLKEYKEEFELTKSSFNIDAVLLDDGSLEKEGKRIFSKR
jgi:BirA family biotin operon repressor/biotin-[acetyl-CoA-carboxylase] ligase